MMKLVAVSACFFVAASTLSAPFAVAQTSDYVASASVAASSADKIGAALFLRPEIKNGASVELSGYVNKRKAETQNTQNDPLDSDIFLITAALGTVRRVKNIEVPAVDRLTIDWENSSFEWPPVKTRFVAFKGGASTFRKVATKAVNSLSVGFTMFEIGRGLMAELTGRPRVNLFDATSREPLCTKSYAPN